MQFNKVLTPDPILQGAHTPDKTPLCVSFDEIEDALVAHRMNTRSKTANTRYQGNQKSGQNDRTNARNTDQRQNRYSARNDNKSQSETDLPFVQCTACGGAGHEEPDCRKKLSYLRLSEWVRLLTPAQRKQFASELDRNARATHEKYKKAYKNRQEIRTKINRLNVDGEARVALLSVFRAQLPDLDFGSLDPDFVDELEPCLDFDPDNDELTE